MTLEFSAGDETPDLWRWLQREDELRGRLRMSPARSGDRDPVVRTMGTGYEIAVAVAAAVPLAASICRYLETRARTRGTDLELRISDGDGNVRAVRLQRLADPERLTQLLLGGTAEPGDAAGGHRATSRS